MIVALLLCASPVFQLVFIRFFFSISLHEIPEPDFVIVTTGCHLINIWQILNAKQWFLADPRGVFRQKESIPFLKWNFFNIIIKVTEKRIHFPCKYDSAKTC